MRGSIGFFDPGALQLLPENVLVVWALLLRVREVFEPGTALLERSSADAIPRQGSREGWLRQ